MKLKEFSDSIATTCNVRAQVVNAVQAETFKQLRAALDKGERVTVPGFGIFSMREIEAKDGEPAKKVLRVRERSAAAKEPGAAKKKAAGGGAKKGGGRKKKAEGDSEE